MMTSENRYFFDTTGYLHLPSALDSTELAAAQAVVQRYIDTPPEELPPTAAATPTALLLARLSKRSPSTLPPGPSSKS